VVKTTNLVFAGYIGVQKGKVLKKHPHCAKQLGDVEHAYQLEAHELGTLC